MATSAGNEGRRRKRRAPASARQRRGPRAARQAERREAILAAALEEFSARGFAATRLDDVARRAGVAKGTIYLYFRDKESAVPGARAHDAQPARGQHRGRAHGRPAGARVAETIADLFVREIFGTRRKDVIRLIITEGARFPKLAEFYYHEVIERVLRRCARCSSARGRRAASFRNDALARFPQLLVAPALVAIVWNGLFERFAPLDVRELMRAHLDLLFGERNAP